MTIVIVKAKLKAAFVQDEVTIPNQCIVDGELDTDLDLWVDGKTLVKSGATLHNDDFSYVRMFNPHEFEIIQFVSVHEVEE